MEPKLAFLALYVTEIEYLKK